MGLISTAVVSVALLLCSQLVAAQAGPNTLAQYNPANRTLSTNLTTCVIPISDATARQISGHNLIPVPASVLPGFPAGMHPLVLEVGYTNDIRMTALNAAPLQIDSLMMAVLLVPYTDVTGDGKTAITVPIKDYIGGTHGRDVQAIVPSVAATLSPLEGTVTFPATFKPDDAAAQGLPNGLYSIEVKPYLLPNQVSGPGIYDEAFDLVYRLSSSSPYAPSTFHNLLNHPQLLDNGQCQRNTLYFNETFADPKMAVGNITISHGLPITPPASIAGIHSDVRCYQANGEMVASLAEPCQAAEAAFDQKARQ